MPGSKEATVFVFPGQSDPWPGESFAVVGELMRAGSPFCEAMNRCAEALDQFVGWSLIDVVRCAVDHVDHGHRDAWQPIHFSVMVSLAAQWRTLGVVPDAVIGLSYGEIAAAHVAGALKLRDAARLITLPANQIRGADAPDPAEFEVIREGLLAELSGLRPSAVDTEFVSTVTGAALDTEILDAEYWFANLRQPPLTEHAVRWAYEHGYRTFVESSVDPILTADIQQWLDRYRGGQGSVSPLAQEICPSRPSDFASSRYWSNNAR